MCQLCADGKSQIRPVWKLKCAIFWKRKYSCLYKLLLLSLLVVCIHKEFLIGSFIVHKILQGSIYYAFRVY